MGRFVCFSCLLPMPASSETGREAEFFSSPCPYPSQTWMPRRERRDSSPSLTSSSLFYIESPVCLFFLPCLSFLFAIKDDDAFLFSSFSMMPFVMPTPCLCFKKSHQQGRRVLFCLWSLVREAGEMLHSLCIHAAERSLFSRKWCLKEPPLTPKPGVLLPSSPT